MRDIHILVVDDDPHICELIQLYGEKNGYRMTSAYDGMEGLRVYYEQSPDLVVLDIMLPEIDGWKVCQEIRRDKQTPVIVLSGKGESYDKIKGFDLGADDYMVKPFDPKELMVRVKAVLRRAYPWMDKVIELPELKIDLKQYTVTCRGEVVAMPPKEKELLYLLACSPNQIFTRGQLLNQLWGVAFEGDPRTVDVHVKRIREKIGDHAPYWSLATIRGVGYKFEVNPA